VGPHLEQILTDNPHLSARERAVLQQRAHALRDPKEQKDYLHVASMTAAHENFLVRGVWPSASGWGRAPGEVATPADLPRFRDVVRAMAGQP
jgi:hypothetical protein